MADGIINILIAGTGGQGVNSLYRIFLALSSRNNIYSKGALFKGGAQRHGTVYATLRLFCNNNPDNRWYSSQIKDKNLDMLIGLEPWETLRYRKYLSRETTIIANEQIVPLFAERYANYPVGNPVEMVKTLSDRVKSENFSDMGADLFNDHRMANYLIGKSSVESGILPFTGNDFNKEFIAIVNPKKEIKKIIKGETS